MKTAGSTGIELRGAEVGIADTGYVAQCCPKLAPGRKGQPKGNLYFQRMILEVM